MTNPAFSFTHSVNIGSLHKQHKITNTNNCLSLLPEVESRTLGSRPRPRIQKNPRPSTAFPRTVTLEAKDRNARGQGSRTQTQVLSKKKKKVFTKIFQAISTKKRFPKKFSSASQNFNSLKNSAVLEPRTGQFSRTWGLEAKDLTFEAKAKDFKMCPRGQGRPRGLHLCLLQVS